MQEIKIMLVSHLAHVRKFVKATVDGEPGFTIACSASNLMEAFSEAEEKKPKLALVSPDFTRLAEFEMVRALFSALDVRWVVVTDDKGGSSSPIRQSGKSYDIFSVDVSEGSRALVRVLRSMTNFPQAGVKPKLSVPHTSSNITFSSASGHIVLIGSSTGGVDALTEVLARFPSNCPPTFIVQHTGTSFGESLVRLLDSRSAAQVVLAKNGLEVGTGMVCVGAGQRAHLNVVGSKSLTCRLTTGAAVSGHIPSVDELFRSALPLANKVVACLLTGMGRDGAEGLLELRRAGARTFVQDEGTSIVYGMPKVAWQIGAAEKRVPISRVAQTIFDSLGHSKRTEEVKPG